MKTKTYINIELLKQWAKESPRISIMELMRKYNMWAKENNYESVSYQRIRRLDIFGDIEVKQ